MNRAIEQKLFHELLEGCPDAVELFDLEGIVLCINQASSKYHGKPESEMVGSSIWNLYSPTQAAHRKTIMNRALNTGQPIRFTDQLNDHWVDVVVAPVQGSSGKIEGVVTYTHDITRQIHAEEQLKLVSLQLFTNQEDERRRIAQDLHDDIGQSMTALILILKTIQSQLLDDPEDTEDAVAQIKDSIRVVEDMMRHIRQVLYELRPPMFDNASIGKILEAFCSSFALSTGLRVVFSGQDQLPVIPNAQATVLYRLLQEGMNNAVKHAKASSVWINLDYVDGEMNISLEDDGQGFDPDQRSSYGIGLQGLRERFSALGGNFDVESSPGKGTRLFGSLPIMITPTV